MGKLKDVGSLELYKELYCAGDLREYLLGENDGN